MKPGTLNGMRLWLPLLATGIVLTFVSWDNQQLAPGKEQLARPTDTLPKKKKQQPRDLDELIAELDALDFQEEMKKVQEDLAQSLKEINTEKLKSDMEKAMKDVDFEKIKKEIKSAMEEVDLQKMQTEMQESMAKIDWEKIKQELEKAKNIDFSKMEAELKEAQKEIEKIGPRLEKEMANVKVDLEKAKKEVEKAKAEMKEFKGFVDGLDSDGLINKKENYRIIHENGELSINGKKVSDAVYKKYRNFLDKHTKFKIVKEDDNFDLDKD